MSADDAPLDRAALEALALVEDPLGVLSVYVDAEPARQAAARAPWQITVEDAVSALRRRLREHGPRERWVALEERLTVIAASLDRATDARGPGRGRALFATLSEPRVRYVTLQVPLVTRVVLESRAYIGPLVAALDRWRPVGVAVVSASGVTLHEMRLGNTREVGRRSFGTDTGDWREMKGPAGANPARSQQTAPQHDRFARRVDVHVTRAIAAEAGDIGATAADRGWERVVVAGDPRLTAVLAEALPVGAPPVHRSDLILDGMCPDEVAAALAGEMDHLEDERLHDLVRRARDGALGGGRGALGLDATRAALAEGRVEHLLLSDRTDLGASADEPNVGERMTEQALGTGAAITPLHGAAADALGPHDGVGALLRW